MSYRDSQKIVIGVDGGQTSIRCLVSDLGGRALALTEAASCSRIMDKANRYEAEARLIDALTFAIELSGRCMSDVASIWIGMSGVPSSQSKVARLWELAVRRHFGTSTEVHADSDVRSSLYGAAGFGPGVVILSGTGSIAYGRDDAGRTARAGGWGYILGDEGSGYAVGMAGIRAVIRAEDGLAPGTKLRNALMGELGLDSVYEIKDLIYSRCITPSKIAALSRIVSSVASEGDPVANQILIDAGRDLSALVVSVMKQLDRMHVPTRVYPVGGVLANEPVIVQSLEDELARTAPLATITDPQLPAVAGSVMLAMQAIGRSPDETCLRLLSHTLPSSPARKPARRPGWTRDSLRNYLKHQLIVSCQATLTDFTDDPYVLTCMAKAAINGGAVAVRANGPETIREMREAFSEPILGINKIDRETNEVYITPTMQAASEIIEAGADFIAIDATKRPRPDGMSVRDLVRQIRSRYDVPIVADISSLDEAVYAAELGVDFVATTLAGYTSYSRSTPTVDLKLIESITQTIPVPVLAEGRILTPTDAVDAIRAGAWAVVVGSAITRPRIITERFARALRDLKRPQA